MYSHNACTFQKAKNKDTGQIAQMTGLEVIKLEYSLRLKIKSNDWLLADTCPQAANHCALFRVENKLTSRPGFLITEQK